MRFYSSYTTIYSDYLSKPITPISKYDRIQTGKEVYPEMTKPFDRITVNPEICMGQPTIRGMRITVAFVLKLLASSMSHEEILKAYPELEEEDILQAIEYAAWLAGEYHRPTPVYAE